MAQVRARGARKDNRFSTVPGPRLPRSSFDLSHSHTTTLDDAGILYPLYTEEVLPGDTINLSPAFFARLATPLNPFVSGIHVDWQFFYVPFRLVWDNFVKMMGERENPDDHNDYVVPKMTATTGTGYLSSSIHDYLTLPTLVPDYEHTALYHRAYNLIFNEWYRDESLQDQVVVDKDDADSDPDDYVLLRRGKRKDYFTGALPFAQKGDAVTLSIGDTAPVTGVDASSSPQFIVGASSDALSVSSGSGTAVSFGPGGITGDLLWDDPELIADLSSAAAVTINQIRTAIGIQHLLERDARGGTRYREQVLAHFGVQTDDIRLLRPELLTSGTMQMEVNPVPATFDLGNFPIGSLRAFSTGKHVGRGFMKSFTEHGLVMGIVSVRADLVYQQGLHRRFTRDTRYEFYWPDLATLGEQVVESREIYTDGTGVADDLTGDFEVWGYQPRYEEYRHRTSVVTGEMRSNHAVSLDSWHLGLDFASRPALNAAFIEENPPLARIQAVAAAPQLILDCFYKTTMARPMPAVSVPGMTRF